MKNTKLKSITLIETLLYIALAAVIILAVSLLITMITQVRTKNKTTTEVENQGAQLMRTITQTIRNSRSVNSPLVGANGTTLSLKMDEAAKNPTVFEITDGRIDVKEGAGTPQDLIGSNVTINEVSFSNLALDQTSAPPEEIRVQFTVKYNSTDPRFGFNYQKTFTGTANLRNSP